MKKYLTSKNLLLAILAIAFFLRFWNVWNQDLFGDEAVDAFRAIGYLDYLGTNFQTTPVEWYKDQPLPWWTKLSFHDFPPLAMIIQHGFFRIFGDSLLIARLPAILLGTLSTYLLYLIVKKLFSSGGGSASGGEDDTLALFSALFFAINSAMVWIFRTSMLEPILLFFIILNIYLFFQFLENKRKWWLFGISLGLVALTKYTGVFLVPVYVTYILISKYRYFEISKYLFAAFGLALLLFSPVLIYNLYLYQATGHFDLQLAYLFNQETPEWKLLIGKTQAPFSEIWKNLLFQRWDRNAATDSIFPVGYYGISAMAAVLAGIVYSIFVFIKNRSRGILFFWLYFVFATLLLMKIGSAHRFLTLYGPAFAVFAGLFLNFLWNPVTRLSTATLPPLSLESQRLKKDGAFAKFIDFITERCRKRSARLGAGWNFRPIPRSGTTDSAMRDLGKETKWNYCSRALVLSFVILEIFHTVSTNFIRFPDYGMAKLDHYFEQEFAGKESAVIPESDNPHLNESIYKFASRKSKIADREFWLIVYNDNIELPTLDWIFYRRFFYHSTPALFVENFNKAISVQGLNYFKPFQIYFVQSTENTILNVLKAVLRGDRTAALEFENYLLSKGLQPEKIIYGKSGLPMFRVYKFTTADL